MSMVRDNQCCLSHQGRELLGQLLELIYPEGFTSSKVAKQTGVHRTTFDKINYQTSCFVQLGKIEALLKSLLVKAQEKDESRRYLHSEIRKYFEKTQPPHLSEGEGHWLPMEYYEYVPVERASTSSRNKEPKITKLGNYSLSGSQETTQNLVNKYPVNTISTNEQFYIDLVGRSEEEKDIFDVLIDPKSYPAIGIWGMGGIGKTRIAREIYLECSKQNLFRVGWIDPSKIFIENTGSEYSPAFETALDHIAQILDRSDLKILEGETKKNEISSLLRTNPVLFIFDNMETLYDEQDKTAKDLISLFSGTRSKLIFTSRVKFRDQDYAINLKKLNGLDRNAGISLIREISKVKKIKQIQNTSDEILGNITQKLGGLPLALNLAVSQFVSTDLASALKGFQDVQFSSDADDYSDFYRFIFLKSWSLINSNCKKILYVLADRPEGESQKERYIGFQTGLSEKEMRNSIQKNWKYAFIEIQEPLEQRGDHLYSLHPITRNFVRTDIKDDQ
jgi:NB-ARC domain